MVRLQEVAERAGVSVATASYALRGHALVKPATRARVEQAARDLGYRKDASAAVLASRQRRAGRAGVRLTLGYLAGEASAHKQSAAFQEAAEARGYDVEWLRFGAGDDPEGVWRRLWNRRVAGLFLAAPSAVPADGGWDRRFDWSRFAVVKFSRARPELRFDLIRHSAFDYMARTVREVAARGRKRLAVLLVPSGVEQDDEARLGAVLGWAALRRPPGLELDWRMFAPEILAPDAPPDRGLRRWLRAWRPDAVIAFPEGFYWKLREDGWMMPKDFAFAGVILNSSQPPSAGCLDDHPTLAQKAVELLDQKIRLGQEGMTTLAQEIVLEPIWSDGTTL